MAANGIETDNHGDKYYFDAAGHYLKNSWQKDEAGQWVYMKANGKMAQNEKIRDNYGDDYYVDNNGHYQINKWAKDSKGNWYYQNKSGKLYKNSWQVVNNSWYYFKPNNVMAANGIETDNHGDKYYFDNNGHYVKNAWHEDKDGNVAYSKANGKLANHEWVKVSDGQWYYFDRNCHRTKNAWHSDGTNVTYTKTNGEQAINEWVKASDGQWYYFDENGYMAHDGWVDTLRLVKKVGITATYNVIKYYFDHNGHYVKNFWHYEGNGNWTYAKLNGVQAINEWVKTPDGQWYYFDYNYNDQNDYNGYMVHDVMKENIPTLNGDGVNTYYFDHNGHYETNTWHEDDNEKIYFKSDGTQAKEEWITTATGQYYFDDSGHMVHDGWFIMPNNDPYYFDHNGRMAHDVMKKNIPILNSDNDVSTYYFDHNGHYETNTWHYDGSEKIYFKSDGTQAKDGWAKASDGQWYYFDKYGHMAHDVMKKDIPTIGGGVVNTYYFDHNGHYEVNTWHKDGNEKIYFKSDGTQANQEWVTTATGRYYFDYKGQMVHGGWVSTIPTNGPVATYYFDDNGHYEVNTWHEDDGNLRYSKANGKQADNEWVITTDGQWHYFNSFGYMAHDCYLGIALPNSDSNVPATIPAYYFDHNGNYIKIGSLPDVENRYIVEEEPNPWCHKGNHLIYKKVDGTQVTNEWIVAGDGNRYYFNDKGYCTKHEKINA